ncbi:MAG: CDP-glucose 4,6-dehydratase [Bacteroidales bacterium]
MMMNNLDIFNNFYAGKKVLVTGHTGFKGSWLSIWLRELGAQVIGFSQDPYSKNDNFVLSCLKDKIVDIRGDIRNKTEVETVFEKYQPDLVFHLAAQPLVRFSYQQPVETYETNVMGTLQVMEAFRKCPSSKVAIMITTDKCYENKEQIWGYRENEAMGGYDPYSSSKGAAEIAIASWRRSFMNPLYYEKHGKSIASVRAGNVIGGGDWMEDRIVPDCIRALEQNLPIEIRSPKAIRPWQFVLEPLSGYLLLAEKIWSTPTQYCEGWNFGPNSDATADVWTIASKIVEYYGNGKLIDVSNPDSLHEAQLLMLDINKAKYKLQWHPRLTLDKTLELTVEWYKKYPSENVYELCKNQIYQYLNQ